MKQLEVIKDIFIVGGPDTTDSRDGCVYIINTLGELVLIDSGAGWSVDKIINNIENWNLQDKEGCKKLYSLLPPPIRSRLSSPKNILSSASIQRRA